MGAPHPDGTPVAPVTARRPWFQPYVAAGTRGSVQTAGAWCSRSECDYCASLRAMPADDAFTSRYWLATT
jgi:hypothetical protein